ncbi:unnamed protein product [Sphagnum jensenii]|jgi:copper chaperone CopZ|uniref:HMA domain-containing protein n=1 Tax=Sphagnum jensenii TaxID=128206 RepID=A0ABP0W3J5_9BRYO
MGQSGSYCTQCQSPISYWGSTMADQSCNCDSRWPPWNGPEYNYDCSGSYFRPIYHPLGGGGGGAPRSFCENDNNPSPYYVRCDERPLDRCYPEQSKTWNRSPQRCDRNHERRRKPKCITVELWVPLCCDKCERKVREHLEDMEGVEKVKLDQSTKKVTVTGDIRPAFALSRAQRRKPESTFWDMRHCMN